MRLYFYYVVSHYISLSSCAALSGDLWLFLQLSILVCCPFLTYLFLPRVLAELERLSLTFLDVGITRSLFVSLTLWTCSTALLISLHLMSPTDLGTTGSVTVAFWLTLASLILNSLVLGMLSVVIPVLFHYLLYTACVTDANPDMDRTPDVVAKIRSVDVWSVSVVLSLLYSCANTVYKFIYFALRLWLLMTLHVFVSVTLTQLSTQVLYTGWVLFMYALPMVVSGYAGFLMVAYLFVFGNVLYIGLQFVVYLGYKLDAFIEAFTLGHVAYILYSTPWCVVAIVTVTFCIGVVAILLAPLLPYVTQAASTFEWCGLYRSVFYTYECGSNTTTPAYLGTPLTAPVGFVMWFLLLDAVVLVVVLTGLQVAFFHTTLFCIVPIVWLVAWCVTL